MTTEYVNVFELEIKSEEEELEGKVIGSDGFESYFDRAKRLNDLKKKRLEIERLKANKSVMKVFRIKK